MERSESQRRINSSYDVPLQIYRQTEVHVSTHETEANSDRAASIDISSAGMPSRGGGVFAGGDYDTETSSHESEIGVITVCQKA